MNAVKSKFGMLRSVRCWSVPTFTRKKNSEMNTGGITDSRSRGTARSARPATADHVGDETGWAGSHVRALDRRGVRCRGRQRGQSSRSLLVVCVGPEVGAGQLEEDVVERRRAQCQVADRYAALGQRDRDAADRRGAVARSTRTTRCRAPPRRARRRRVRPRCAARCASPSTRATIMSVPIDRLSSAGVPSATMRPRSMIPTRSASASASSRYCVVRKIVMPRLGVETAHLLPHDRAAGRVEAGRRLVEEQDVAGCGSARRRGRAAASCRRSRSRCGDRARR